MKIKMLTYNIHKGFNFTGIEFILHQIKKMIQETEADFVFLQEVVGENQRHRKKVATWPTETQFEFLADNVWKHYAYGKNAVFPYRHHGNAILSRFPILSFQNTSLTMNAFEQRGLLHCQIQIPEYKNKIHLFNVHLDLFHGSRMKQLHQIIKNIQFHTMANEPLILAGDFNDWSEKLSVHFDELLGLKDAHYVLHQKHARTFPAFSPFLCLDRIYFKNLQPLQTHRLDYHPWSSLSDHLPLFCEFELA